VVFIDDWAYAVNALGKRTWNDAARAAKNLTCCDFKGQLAFFFFERKRDLVKTLFGSGGVGGSNRVGFTDAAVERGFQWTDGGMYPFPLNTTIIPVAGNTDANDRGVYSLDGGTGTETWTVTP
jgi:hypothetical protein